MQLRWIAVSSGLLLVHLTVVNICILLACLSQPFIMDVEPCGMEQVTSGEILGLYKMLKLKLFKYARHFHELYPELKV